MTREEAIAHGKEQLEIFGGEHREFIEKAIKALEQEPCEDAISREAAEDVVMWYDGQGAMLNEIHKLPSVQPKPKTGYFEWKSDGFLEFGNWHCSECQLIVIYHVKKDDKCGIPWFNYCPNCGAKMEEQK